MNNAGVRQVVGNAFTETPGVPVIIAATSLAFAVWNIGLALTSLKPSTFELGS